MFKSYLLVSIRHILKNKSASLISAFSLIFSLTFSVIILMYVAGERMYDSHIPNKDNKFRMNYDIYGSSGRNIHSASAPSPFAPFFADKVPEIQDFTRVYTQQNVLVSNPGTSATKLERVGWADENFLEFFGIEVILGDGKISDLNSVLVSEQTAISLFGSPESSLGKVISYNGSKNLTVQAIFQDFPHHSNIQVDAVGNIEVLQELIPWYYQNGENWGGYSFQTFFDFSAGVDVQEVVKRFRQHCYDRFEISLENLPAEYSDFELINVQDIHLHSDVDYEMTPASSVLKIRLLEYLAIVIAIIGWINFINIQTAKVPERLKEIGVRKSLGARKASLKLMFFMEYFTICLVTLFLAALIVHSFGGG